MRSGKTRNALFVGISALILLICAGILSSVAASNARAYGDDLTPKHNDRRTRDPRAQDDELKLTDEDRAEIVSQTLRREIALIKEERAKYEAPSKADLTLRLSTQNIKPSLVPDIPGVKFILLEPAEIEKRTKEGRGISYLAFVKFEVKGPVVMVSLSNAFRGMGRVRPFISIRTNNYEYRREDGKWVGKLVNSGRLIT